MTRKSGGGSIGGRQTTCKFIAKEGTIIIFTMITDDGIELIAEKCESERQIVDILELDVAMGQGHLFGEPRAIKEAVLAETDPPADFIRSTLRSADQRRRFN